MFGDMEPNETKEFELIGSAARRALESCERAMEKPSGGFEPDKFQQPEPAPAGDGIGNAASNRPVHPLREGEAI